MSESLQQHSENCPLTPVDRRLSDLHRQWHDAESAYFDPDRFRMAIQTCIQTARTVSFILQSNKGLFDDFDAWYAPWQSQFRSIPLMKWMVEARNTIEKRGDLESNSEIKVGILASHLSKEILSTDVKGDLFDSVQELLSQVPKYTLAEHIMRDGTLQIERRWVANDLPDFELLDAVAHAYGHLSRLVHDAHAVLGLTEPIVVNEADGLSFDHHSMKGRLPCMIAHSRRRVLNIWLATGEPFELQTESIEVDKAQGECSLDRYGIAPEEVFGLATSPDGTLKSLFATARKMFLRDEYHATITFLLKGVKPVGIIEWRPEDHGQKYLMSQLLADEVIRRGADAVVLLGEVWMAKFDPSTPLARAVDSAVRVEALAGTLVSKSGEPLRLIAEIVRGQASVELKPTEEMTGGAHFYFASVYEAWGREIPADWKQS